MATYSLTLRSDKGSKLTTEELDNNFRYLDNKTNGGGGSTTGGYQLLGTLEVDMNAGTYPLDNPFVFVDMQNSATQFAEGDVINYANNKGMPILIYGTASILSKKPKHLIALVINQLMI